MCLEGPTDRYVQFISKLDRKYCRMLVGVLQYMLHKMKKAKTPSCRKCRYMFYVNGQCWKR